MTIIFRSGSIINSTAAGKLSLYNPNKPTITAGVAPSLDYRFANDKSSIEAVSLQNQLTVTNVDANGVYVSSGGALEAATVNTPRFTHSETTRFSQGLLVEEARTNSLRNNTMVGAVVGSTLGSQLPTHWREVGVFQVTRTILDVGTENGIHYIDFRWNGSSSVEINSALIEFNPLAANGIPAAAAETWSAGCYFSLLAGSMSGIARFDYTLAERDVNYSFVASSASNLLTLTNARMITQRRLIRRVLTGASTAYVTSGLGMNLLANTNIDFTLRVGMPQLEKGDGASTVIATSNGAVTRSADNIQINPTKGVLSGAYTLVEKPPGCATVSGASIILNTGFTAERVMVFPASLTEAKKTSIRNVM